MIKDVKNFCKKNKTAQTAIELAVFGSIVIFLVGAIVSATHNFGYEQNIHLKAIRKALTVSFLYSEGLVAPPGAGPEWWETGSASRNQANILLLVDRLTSSSAKYAAVDRVPQMVSASGTHSRNMFMPVEDSQTDGQVNLNRMDFYVNGAHFPLTTVREKTVHLRDPVAFKVIANHPVLNWCDCTAAPNSHAADCESIVNGVHYKRFNLDRDPGGIIDVSNQECHDFGWQWHAIPTSKVDAENQINIQVDVDYDDQNNIDRRDIKPEQVLRKIGPKTMVVWDFQDGDMDQTISDGEVDGSGNPRPMPGFTSQDVMMFTYTSNPFNPSDPQNRGTYLLLEQGKLYSTDPDKHFIRSAQKKDSVDIIQRALQLSNDTGRFCHNGTPTGPNHTNGIDWDSTMASPQKSPNPVEVCCPREQPPLCDDPMDPACQPPTRGCCFEDAHISKTCMATGGIGTRDPVIYVRSRVKDIHGRKWVMPLDQDPRVEFDLK